MNEQTDTPRHDEWETYCDECYYHMWRVRRKNERGFNDGFHLNDGEGARQLVDLLNKQDSELTAARAEIERLNFSLKQASSIYDVVTEQRDRLAHELERITITGSAEHCRKIADEALQSLTTNEKSPSTGATE